MPSGDEDDWLSTSRAWRQVPTPAGGFETQHGALKTRGWPAPAALQRNERGDAGHHLRADDGRINNPIILRIHADANNCRSLVVDEEQDSKTAHLLTYAITVFSTPSRLARAADFGFEN